MKLLRHSPKEDRAAGGRGFIQNRPWYSNIFGQRPQQHAEAHWDKFVSPNLSKDQKVLLAEQLFGYVWRQHGSTEALNQIMDTTQQLQLAEARFNKGCHLWGQQLFESALMEIQKSKDIQMSQGSWCNQEMEVQLHYATGMNFVGLQQYDKALAEFRQAWRVSGLELGSKHILTRASQHMIESVLSKQRCGIMEIHHELIIIQQAIVHEKEGDFLQQCGDMDLDVAIYEYQQSLLEYQRHQEQPQVQDATAERAAILCKIASVLERQDKRGSAETEWATALSLYQSALGSQHPKTIETMTRLTRNHCLVQASRSVNGGS
jgi:tetratricopeptide (TPR) repeat protein